MPQDPRIRPATVEDAEGITRCHIGGWQVHYRGILPDAVLDAIDFDERLALRSRMLAEDVAASEGDEGRRRRNWVLEEEGRIRGWVADGPERDEDLGPGTCELYAIYLDPKRVGQGYGRALMQDCLARAAAAGYDEMVMWVLAGNERARRFYAAAGFRNDERVPAALFGDTGATKLRMRRELEAPAG